MLFSGDLLHSGIKLESSASLTLQADSFTAELLGKPSFGCKGL